MNNQREFKKIISDLKASCDLDLAQLKVQQDHPQKILGLMGYHFPEELFLAADIHSLYLEPDNKPVMAADSLLQIFACSQVKSVLAQGLRGELEPLDGIVFGHGCDSIKNVAGVWKLTFPEYFVDYFRYPTFPQARGTYEFLRAECARLLKRLQHVSGREITEQDLERAITIMTVIREKLTAVRELFLAHNHLFPYRDLLTVYRAVFKLEKTLIQEKLTQLLPVMEDCLKTNQSQGELTNNKQPIVVTGSRIDYWLVEDIEECGASIVADDLYWGSRWLKTQMSNSSQKAALDQIIDNLQQRIIEPHNYDPHQARLKNIIKTVEKTNARGVLYIQYKFCESHAFEYPTFRAELQKAAIPIYLIEIDTDYSAGREQIKNRICSFIEMI
ncbi:2-hydroxyacyl-CoA dehydratase subunit D [candidate division CSSED10-310 bacterium]|uniref:2-hydroxyacyl-CoA dehydratase subunit D n=1 Tax=candidate division CSSED10-310 bacterium TaxID=2855610 RepID=A0ABV6YY49_UNCC1